MRRACVGPLRKSGSPKVMCSAPASHLGADVGQYDLHRHDAEPPVVDRHDRTVPAAVLAAARGLGGADDGQPAVGPLQLARRRRAAAGPARSGTWNASRGSAACGRRRQRLAGVRLRAPPRPGRPRLRGRAPPCTPAAASCVAVERRVEPVGADRQVGAMPADGGDHRQGQARGGVHRQVHRRHRHAVERAPRSAARPTGRSSRTSNPAWRSHAAGDARPNGWRPSS